MRASNLTPEIKKSPSRQPERHADSEFPVREIRNQLEASDVDMPSLPIRKEMLSRQAL